MPDKYDLQKPSRKSSSAKNAPRSTQPKVEWKGYISVPLVENDKRHYFQWCQQTAIVTEVKETTLRDGFKLSTDFQQREGAFRASLYCQNPDYIEAGYSLSMWAGSADEAEMRLLYVHAVKCQGSWERYIGKSPRDDDWENFRD